MEAQKVTWKYVRMGMRQRKEQLRVHARMMFVCTSLKANECVNEDKDEL